MDKKILLVKSEDSWTLELRRDNDSSIKLIQVTGGNQLRLTLEQLYGKLI